MCLEWSCTEESLSALQHCWRRGCFYLEPCLGIWSCADVSLIKVRNHNSIHAHDSSDLTGEEKHLCFCTLQSHNRVCCGWPLLKALLNSWSYYFSVLVQRQGSLEMSFKVSRSQWQSCLFSRSLKVQRLRYYLMPSLCLIEWRFFLIWRFSVSGVSSSQETFLLDVSVKPWLPKVGMVAAVRRCDPHAYSSPFLCHFFP